MSDRFDSLREFLQDLKHKIMGTYFESGLDVYSNLDRILREPNNEMLIRTRNGGDVRGHLLNYQPSEGFTVWPLPPVPEVSITIPLNDVRKAYLLKHST